MRSHGSTVLESLTVATAMPAAADFMSNVQVRTVTERIRDGLTLDHGDAIHRNPPVDLISNGTRWPVVAPDAC